MSDEDEPSARAVAELHHVQQIVLRTFLGHLLECLDKDALNNLRERIYLQLERNPQPSDFLDEKNKSAARVTNIEWKKYAEMVEQAASD